MLQAVIAWPPRRLVCHMEVVSDTGESDKLSLVTSIIAKRACILFCFSLKYLMLLLVAGPGRVASKAPGLGSNQQRRQRRPAQPAPAQTVEPFPCLERG